MKKTILFFYLISVSSVCIEAQIKCDCTTFIDWKFYEKISVFSRPNGNIIKVISNDSINEDIVALKIIESNESFYKAIFSSSLTDEFIVEGWIRKTEPIGIFGNNYANRSFNLYSQPNQKSQILYTINEWIPEMYLVLDCFGNFMKVKIVCNDKVYEGWIESKNTCSNPYSTCS